MGVQMKPNPIVKIITGHWSSMGNNNKHGSTRAWGFKCPDCEDQPRLSRLGYRTRKKAKDAYYRHRKEAHAGPLVGCLGSS